MPLHFVRPLAFLAVVLSLAIPAIAQELPTVLPGDYVMSDILNKQRVAAEIGLGRSSEAQSDQAFAPQWTPSPALPAGTPTPRAPIAAMTSTSYYADPQVSARVRAQFGEWLAKETGAAGGPRLADAIAQRDPVRDWAAIVEGDGLHPGDMADVMASYWILNWVMANGADSNQTQAQAARKQMRRMFNPGFVRLMGPPHQELSEALMLNFLMQHAAYVDAVKRDDRAALKQLGDAAQMRFSKELAVDLRQITLTGNGFARGK